MLRKHADKCGGEGELLTVAGDSLVAYYEILRNEGRAMTTRGKMRLMHHGVNHILAYQNAGGHMVPKHHAFVHLTRGILFSGNPRFTSTYEDEHENGVVGQIALRVHGTTFTSSVFERLEVLDTLLSPEYRKL